tara:strand:+ start:431 stop:610 length:180 start_codon:yes stop_codon:yes gene_type:complete
LSPESSKKYAENTPFSSPTIRSLLWQRQHQAADTEPVSFFAENGQKTEDGTPEDDWQQG